MQLMFDIFIKDKSLKRKFKLKEILKFPKYPPDNPSCLALHTIAALGQSKPPLAPSTKILATCLMNRYKCIILGWNRGRTRMRMINLCF